MIALSKIIFDIIYLTVALLGFGAKWPQGREAERRRTETKTLKSVEG